MHCMSIALFALQPPQSIHTLHYTRHMAKDEDELRAEYKSNLLRTHKEVHHNDIDDVRSFDTTEFSNGFLSLKGKFQNCPSRLAPLCADSDREITEMLKKCKTVNSDIREVCLRDLETYGFRDFKRCTALQTRIAQVKMHEVLNRMIRRQKRVEQDAGI